MGNFVRLKYRAYFRAFLENLTLPRYNKEKFLYRFFLLKINIFKLKQPWSKPCENIGTRTAYN